jgi:superfamily II DNA or RNA helicase
MLDCALCRTSNNAIVTCAPHPAPLSRGHTMLFPGRHVGSYWSCTPEERSALQTLLRELSARVHGSGYTVGFSTEREHFYLELIPRYGEALHPYTFQRDILARLHEERSARNLRRNLLVAATGSGKTMMAAFDYARQQTRPRLLFVAHRAELLTQARDTFREVLQLPSFGELLSGTEKPASDEYLFATIQSLESSGLLQKRASSYWEFVIVDECHHIPAP